MHLMFDLPVDIENEKIRDGINTELDNATESSSLTPYIALEKVRKILMPYHIHVPRYLFKDDEHGILTFEARQFGDIYGMKDDGQVYTKDEYPYLLYFEYQKNEIGMYDVFCEIIDRADLADIQKDLEEEGDDLMEGKVIPFPTKKPKTDENIPRGFLPPDDDTFKFKNDDESDYNLARTTFRNLIQQGNLAMEDMKELARQSESPRAYEVFATMMKTIADTTNNLYDLQKKTKELKDEPQKKPHDGGVTVERAVFVGTTSDLLKKIKAEKQ